MAKMVLANVADQPGQQRLSVFVANDKDMHAFMRSKLSNDIVFLRLVHGMNGLTVSTVDPDTAAQEYAAAAVAADADVKDIDRREKVAKDVKAEAAREISTLQRVRTARLQLCVRCACSRV